MDTIVIKTNDSSKAKYLMELLRSMDFVSQVEFVDKYIKGQKLLEEVNKIAAKSDLSKMTLDEINTEISNYRNGQ